MAETGETIDDDICFKSYMASGDGDCVNPAPLRHPDSMGWWRIFDSSFHATVWRGSELGEKVPVGRLRTEQESIARAIGEPWDERTLDMIELIELAWLKKEWNKRRKRKGKDADTDDDDLVIDDDEE